jgi:hypothetical protein
VEEVADILPQGTLSFKFFLNRPEQDAGQLLGLVDEKNEHHEIDKHLAQMLLAQPKVVLEVVALILEGIEGLVFDLPARSASAHELVNVVPGDGKIGDPAAVRIY